MKFIRILLLALAAFALMAQATPPTAPTPSTPPASPAGGDPSGDWAFTVQGPRGKAVDATLTLKWADGQLTGTITNRAGKATISSGTFADGQVAFTVIREVRRREITTQYSGKLDGDKLTGSIVTAGPKGKSVTVVWEAHRVPPAPPAAP